MSVAFACPHCGRQTLVDDRYVGQSGPCSGCGQSVTVVPVRPPLPSIEEIAAIRMLIPIGRSGWAIFGLVAGIVFPTLVILLIAWAAR